MPTPEKEGPGLDFQLYPGELGKRIFDNISKEAWAEWQKKQVMLINEKKLNMMNLEHRQLLEKRWSATCLMQVKCRLKVTPRLPSKLSGCCTCEPERHGATGWHDCS